MVAAAIHKRRGQVAIASQLTNRQPNTAFGNFPGAPDSYRPRCVMLKMGVAVGVGAGTFFQVLRHRTDRGMLFRHDRESHHWVASGVSSE
jgi:hypothetical protein